VKDFLKANWWKIIVGVFTLGGLYVQVQLTDAKVERMDPKVSAMEIKQAVQDEKIGAIKSDVSEIKADIKILLRRREK